MSLAIKDFYLNTDLESPEYMILPIALVPDEIMLSSIPASATIALKTDPGGASGPLFPRVQSGSRRRNLLGAKPQMKRRTNPIL